MTINVMGIIVQCDLEECYNGLHITPSDAQACLGMSIRARTAKSAIRAAGWHMRNGHDFCSPECLGKYARGDRINERPLARDACHFPIVAFIQPPEEREEDGPSTLLSDQSSTTEEKDDRS